MEKRNPATKSISEESREDVTVSVRLTSAVGQQLEEIANEMGRSKSDIIREAILILIGMYNDATRATGKIPLP